MSKRAADAYDYPEDEFDRIAADQEGPVGTHREPRSLGRRLAPFIVVLVVTPALAYVIVAFLLGDFGSDEPTAQPTQTVSTDDPADDPTDWGPGLSFDDDTGEDGDGTAAEPDMATGVQVVNGAKKSGIAGKATETLKTAGFTNLAEPATYSGSDDPKVSTVYYASEDLKATADAVASALGLQTVQLDAERTTSIMVLLAPDFVG